MIWNPERLAALKGKVVILAIGARFKITHYHRAEQRITVRNMHPGHVAPDSSISTRELLHALRDGIARIES